MWLAAAILSAVFAGLTAILAKCGIRKTNSDVATALRTAVVLLFSCVMVMIVGSFSEITSIDPKSWICYFKALSLGSVNKVTPVDKSSTVLSVLLAIIILGETSHLAVKLICIVLIGAGTILMIEKKDVETKIKSRGWFIYAILSAIFAALTSILAKIGIDGVESNLGTAIRTAVVLVMAWIIVFAKGEHKQLCKIEKKELMYITLSGLATGASWLCYYYAIQNGIVSVVVPVDKMSILVTVMFSYFVFKEKLSKKAMLGLGMMAVGTLAMAIWA